MYAGKLLALQSALAMVAVKFKTVGQASYLSLTQPRWRQVRCLSYEARPSVGPQRSGFPGTVQSGRPVRHLGRGRDCGWQRRRRADPRRALPESGSNPPEAAADV